MIDPEVRKSLSQDVRRLITGRMTNDAFDDIYYEEYQSADDRACCFRIACVVGMPLMQKLDPQRLELFCFCDRDSSTSGQTYRTIRSYG